MAVIHRAYSFDSGLFHRYLQEKTVHQKLLRLDVLLQLAEETVAGASETTQQALEDLRFDDGWFETSDDGVTWSTHWYMIILARHLTPAPSLSNRSPVSWKVLDLTLSTLGWGHAELETLLRGQPLHTLVESSNNPLFVTEFTCINQFGGWLRQSEVRRLYSHLLQTQRLHSRYAVSEELSKFALLWSQSPAEMLGQAYADAMEMLTVALDKDEALFVVLD